MHVIFGTGPLGKSVMRALIAQHKSVRLVNRSGKANVLGGVDVVAADAYDAASATAAAEGATVIYQCAQPPYAEWVEKFPALQDGVMQAAINTGAKFIVAENLYMYGEVDGPIHENLPWTAHTRKGKVRAKMAEEVLDAHENGVIQAAIARGSDFYGPEVKDSTMGERIFPAVLKGKTAQAVGNIDLPHSYTYINDFGKAMAIIGERDEALGDVWHVPNAPARSTREIIELAFAQTENEPKISSMGKFMMRIGGLFVPEAREIVEMMYEFENPFVVDSSKFLREFGDITTPFEQGIRETLRWYRNKLS